MKPYNSNLQTLFIIGIFFLCISSVNAETLEEYYNKEAPPLGDTITIPRIKIESKDVFISPATATKIVLRNRYKLLRIKEMKIDIGGVNEIKTILNGVRNYKRKELVDLFCPYELVIYGKDLSMLKMYNVGTFPEDKNIVIVEDSTVNQDYFIDGKAASLIQKYIEKIKVTSYF